MGRHTRGITYPLALGLAVSLGGCYTIRYDVANDKPTVALSNTAGKFTRHYTREERAIFLAGGLAPLIAPRPIEMALQLAGGRKVSSLTITSYMGPWDLAFKLAVMGVGYLGLTLATGLLPASTDQTVRVVVNLSIPLIGWLLVPELRTLVFDFDVVE